MCTIWEHHLKGKYTLNDASGGWETWWCHLQVTSLMIMWGYHTGVSIPSRIASKSPCWHTVRTSQPYYVIINHSPLLFIQIAVSPLKWFPFAVLRICILILSLVFFFSKPLRWGCLWAFCATIPCMPTWNVSIYAMCLLWFHPKYILLTDIDMWSLFCFKQLSMPQWNIWNHFPTVVRVILNALLCDVVKTENVEQISLPISFRVNLTYIKRS